ncbi:hypothetical protein BCR37DRAFT_163309 [Protomyces lactucae-debilis]|uniref:Uncharacterized protein n=1 Tax=Protomyces lactucae-debilis TaxID=2754530 RepID=A0A1Y2EYJ0_PROLT|nr:uncharacterized protein BCR37DRAFT_163309 [Protomyces lactucae-debilis]ORY76701.1 hypothetical protein BCR37DRAFT_163309 [Protomyces lactucae-debilis]
MATRGLGLKTSQTLSCQYLPAIWTTSMSCSCSHLHQSCTTHGCNMVARARKLRLSKVKAKENELALGLLHIALSSALLTLLRRWL